MHSMESVFKRAMGNDLVLRKKRATGFPRFLTGFSTLLVENLLPMRYRIVHRPKDIKTLIRAKTLNLLFNSCVMARIGVEATSFSST